MQRPRAPKARRPTFGPLCIRPTILPFLCSCPFLVSIFTVGLCVLWVLCGPSKATARCYTSICDGIIKGFSGPIGPRVGENMQFLGFLLGESTYFIGYMLPTFGILCNLGGFCGPFGPRVGKFAFFDVILLKA